MHNDFCFRLPWKVRTGVPFVLSFKCSIRFSIRNLDLFFICECCSSSFGSNEFSTKIVLYDRQFAMGECILIVAFESFSIVYAVWLYAICSGVLWCTLKVERIILVFRIVCDRLNARKIYAKRLRQITKMCSLQLQNSRCKCIFRASRSTYKYTKQEKKHAETKPFGGKKINVRYFCVCMWSVIHAFDIPFWVASSMQMNVKLQRKINLTAFFLCTIAWCLMRVSPWHVSHVLPHTDNFRDSAT